MWTIFWSTVLLACTGTLFLRIAGRKSISQMTIPQLVILLALGTLLGSEVSGKGLAKTILSLGTFVMLLVVFEWVSLRWNRAETALKGKTVPVIEQGQLLLSNMRKLRLTVDDLEKRLRMAGISRIEDVKTGTIEDNGELGYELFPDLKPVTKRDLEALLKTYFPQISVQMASNETTEKESIFPEITTDSQHTSNNSLQ